MGVATTKQLPLSVHYGETGRTQDAIKPNRQLSPSSVLYEHDIESDVLIIDLC